MRAMTVQAVRRNNAAAICFSSQSNGPQPRARRLRQNPRVNGRRDAAVGKGRNRAEDAVSRPSDFHHNHHVRSRRDDLLRKLEHVRRETRVRLTAEIVIAPSE